MRAPNTDVAIYLAPNAPPAAPDSLIRGHLSEQFRAGSEANEGNRTWKWTALLDVPLGADIRDNYPGLPQQTVYVPDKDGEAYLVVFVERIRDFRGQNFKRVYLDKAPPVAPANNCCADMPNVVTATVSLGAGCPCLAGVEVTLTYNALTNRWEGVTPDACAGNFDLSIILECDPASCGPGNGCEGWKLTVTFEDHGTVADQCVDAGCSCDPLELTFTGIVFPDQGAECDGGIQIVVTE